MVRRILVLALMVMLAGCAPGDPAAAERIDAALLRLSDLPPDEGWTVDTNATDDPAQLEFEAGLERCEEEHDPTFGARAAERESDTFVRGEVITASSTAVVVPDEGLRTEYFAALDPLVECFGGALKSALERLVLQTVDTAGNVQSAQVVVSPPYRFDATTEADRTDARAFQIGLHIADRQNFFVDLVVIEQGETLLLAEFLHQGELESSDLEKILAPAVKRLQEL